MIAYTRLLGFILWAALPFLCCAASTLEGKDSLPDQARLSELILRISGHKVLPWAGQDMELFQRAALDALDRINVKGIERRRINEVGLEAEQFIRTALKKQQFDVDTPNVENGRRQSSGYPDVILTKGDRIFYLEVKVHQAKTRHSTQRTFYLSAHSSSKIHHDAHHLMVSFSMEKNESDGRFYAKGVKFLDLHALPCRLKYEYNASNKDLYGGSDLVRFEYKAPVSGK